MLKPEKILEEPLEPNQPPSGGCVLKPLLEYHHGRIPAQPPSGGCVLKLTQVESILTHILPAAFGRLCVETALATADVASVLPAAFGRLCVETSPNGFVDGRTKPAAFGRLCVETAKAADDAAAALASRLRAAVC